MARSVEIVRAALRKPALEGAAPSQAQLAQEQADLQRGHAATLERVGELVRSHHALSREVGGELSTALEHKAALEALAARDADTGILASLTRALTRRRAILERKSVAEGLVAQFQAVQVSLTRASAFSDELRLCALELQAEVDRLHTESARAGRNATACAGKVLEIEAALEALPTLPDLSADERARFTDALQFEERSLGIALELYRARRTLCRQELDPTRELRDTVLDLHENMARFVQQAGAAVGGQGHRIQALGLAADAPTVVAELNARMQSMDQLAQASQVYIDQAQHLLTEVLPELSHRLGEASRHRAVAVADDLDGLSRERARELADRALKEAAAAEVEQALATERRL
jgi:ABC-type transporter Mla subunit MlaD